MVKAIGWLGVVVLTMAGACTEESAHPRPYEDQQRAPVAARSRARTGPPATIDLVAVPDGKRQIVEAAVLVFVDACTVHMQPHWADVESATATYERFGPRAEAYDYRQINYGWSARVIIELKMSNNPTTFADARSAMGQVLAYHLGAGKKPGITTSKEVAKQLCGMSSPAGDDAFRAVPELKIVK